MKKITKILKKVFKILSKDPQLSFTIFLLLAGFIAGSILIDLVKSAAIIGVLSVFVAISTLIRKHKEKKYGPDYKKKRHKKLKNYIIIFCLIMAILGVIAVGYFFYYIVKSSPAFEEKKLYTQDTSIVYDADNNVIAKLGREKRQKITFNQLPQVLIDAVIATEDSRYFQHNGFDLPRFAKASLGQAMGNSSAGGGSTLTMQVVKNTLTNTNQNIIRKFTDIYMAVFVLEKKYTKEQIFELYVNIPFLGANAYVVEE